jgi:hypothetical protein
MPEGITREPEVFHLAYTVWFVVERRAIPRVEGFANQTIIIPI